MLRSGNAGKTRKAEPVELPADRRGVRPRLRLPFVALRPKRQALPWVLLAASGAAFTVGAWTVDRTVGVLTLGVVLLAAGVATAFVLGAGGADE